MSQSRCAKCRAYLTPATVSARSGCYCRTCLPVPATSPGVVTAQDMRTTRREGPMPAHLAAWGETEATWDRCDAMWTLEFGHSLPIRGCPLGRGRTEHEAMLDLVRRTNAESGLSLTFHPES